MSQHHQAAAVTKIIWKWFNDVYRVRCVYTAYQHMNMAFPVCMIKCKVTCSIARLLLCYMVLSVKSLLQIDRITVHYSY
jgi:hypothetical protein